ncbi:preprotein translocase subunit YajC [Komagataeibacter intermedius]|uniref:Sec translocon accessory complex subunit YajC n=2 Tax=Komagataeibacter intermedius TaxID=66229 RepID=A0A0N1N552_9PROT|nr:preprotein translocase subunit YajC [Komagataeibacter intermedius]KPH87587.1 preprotein translocase subunit YajC [Komagataeibacter intermedius AF2]MCF3636305.1 preprotein translocase subunit YajC [Komagataeibacter intermedius]GAN85926.1 protein translocase subunit YajC [Komagataeibacter intermedius TF2]
MPSIINDFLTTSAHAQSAGGGLLSGDGIMAMLPYVAMFAIFYFLLIRPQQVKQKQLRNQIASLRRGDRVLTAGGVIGVVQKVQAESNEVEVEIAPNVRVTVIRDTLGSVITSASTPANDSTPDKPAK